MSGPRIENKNLPDVARAPQTAYTSPSPANPSRDLPYLRLNTSAAHRVSGPIGPSPHLDRLSEILPLLFDILHASSAPTLKLARRRPPHLARTNLLHHHPRFPIRTRHLPGHSAPPSLSAPEPNASSYYSMAF